MDIIEKRDNIPEPFLKKLTMPNRMFLVIQGNREATSH